MVNGQSQSRVERRKARRWNQARRVRPAAQRKSRRPSRDEGSPWVPAGRRGRRVLFFLLKARAPRESGNHSKRAGLAALRIWSILRTWVYSVQVGRVPQEMPWALKASQIRQALGVPLARLPSSSSAVRNTVYQLVEPQPSTTAAGLHLPPETTR